MTVEVVCEHGAFVPGLNRICRNADAITFALTIVAVGALTVASGGAFAAIAIEIGGGTGFLVGASAGGTGVLLGGGGIAVSATVLENLAIGVGAGGLAVAMTRGSGPGNVPNRAHQQRQFNDAWRDCQRQLGRTMGRAERRILHDAISGQGFEGYHEILAECLQLFG
jgi:hypothetical protein